jgi:hypothetical protein
VNAPPRDNGGPLDILHPWHPWDDDHTEAAPFFTRLINQCGVFATVFAVEERERARTGDRLAVPERRFVQPLPPIDVGPAALPPPPIPVAPYQELAETTLTYEWFTGPGVAVPAADEEPPPPRRWIGGAYRDHPGRRRHTHRASNGRYAPKDAGAA